jgi:methylated-DNA-protein-cysteine methyltransferase-like protein
VLVNSQLIRAVIQAIPSGRVRSYGDVARQAGLTHGARQVARLLHSAGAELPWHRVVNSQRRISLTGPTGERQRSLLEQEGIVFDQEDRIQPEFFMPSDVES